uniref:Uncharacterized protein n=1 Tax=Setaria viridis TaxID=4556 RepID=A0A4U6TH47_SETVI|nr:hypothetical protein SEVIR_8G194200v2 [Setaria viridis]
MASTPTGTRRTETKGLRVRRGLRARRWQDGPQDSLNGSCCVWLIFNASYQRIEEQSDPTKSTSTSEVGRMLKDHAVHHVERRSCTRSNVL